MARDPYDDEYYARHSGRYDKGYDLMSTKPQPTKLGFNVICPRCQRVHEFEYVRKNALVLDGDADDTFTVVEHRLYPDWVCRNSRCTKTPETLYLR